MGIEATYSGECARCPYPILPGNVIEALTTGEWIHDSCMRVGDRLKGGWTIIELEEKLPEGVVKAEGADGKSRKLKVEGTDE